MRLANANDKADRAAKRLGYVLKREDNDQFWTGSGWAADLSAAKLYPKPAATWPDRDRLEAEMRDVRCSHPGVIE